MSTTKIQQAKQLFCTAINVKCGEELKIEATDESLFYKVQPGKNEEYPDVFQVRLRTTHAAYKYCFCMKSGVHDRSKKPRYFNVNISSGAVSQACFAQYCMKKKNKGRCMVYAGEDEDESEDEAAEYKFGTPSMPKKRKRE